MPSQRVSIRFVTGVCLLVLLGCARTPQQPAMSVTAAPPEVSVAELAAKLEKTSLESEAEVAGVVANAAAAPRAIMFVHVDWAPMEPFRTRFAKFMLAYQAKHPNEPVMFHYVDCTPITSSYAPLV